MVAAALPLLLAGPAFFAGAIGLGVLVQLGQAFTEVVKALSWLQEHWPQIADWRSHVERLGRLEDSLAEAATLRREGGIVVEAGGDTLVLDRVTLRAPDGRVLLDGASAVVREGDRVLIQGASGCGKAMPADTRGETRGTASAVSSMPARLWACAFTAEAPARIATPAMNARAAGRREKVRPIPRMTPALHGTSVGRNPSL